jgi:hypothetical protein
VTVEVVAHHRIGGDIDGEYRSELLQALDDPAAPVLEVAAGLVSKPQRYARRTQRETTWYQGVASSETRVDRGWVMQDSFRGI